MSDPTREPPAPAPVLGGVSLECKHCGSTRFRHRTSQLNTTLLSFLDLDWLNVSADVFVCQDCGFLHWFLGEKTPEAPLPPEEVPADDTSEPSVCLDCGKPIPAGSYTCAACGWSYGGDGEDS